MRLFWDLPIISTLFSAGLQVVYNRMQPPESLVAANFDNREEELAQKLLKNKYISLVEDAGPDGSNAIQVSYQGYEQGSKRVVVSSILPRPLKEATLCYKVRFANDFQFVLGGKLHGLGPQRPITGGEDMRPDGWSARIMWKEKGSLRTYIYHQDKPTKWGQGKMADGFYFQPGRWYSLTLCGLKPRRFFRLYLKGPVKRHFCHRPSTLLLSLHKVRGFRLLFDWLSGYDHYANSVRSTSCNYLPSGDPGFLRSEEGGYFSLN